MLAAHLSNHSFILEPDEMMNNNVRDRTENYIWFVQIAN